MQHIKKLTGILFSLALHAVPSHADESFDDHLSLGFNESSGFNEHAGMYEAASQTSVKKDRFESFNRVVFGFNMTIDKWLLRPLAVGYKAVTPDVVETGIGNFFSNIGEVSNIANDILQWKWKQAGNDTGRLLVNSTIGLAGIFDVAGKTGMPESDGEDFGQTLVHWGLPQGPYIVLPFMGPGTVTSTLGLPAEWYLDPVSEVTPDSSMYALKVTDLVHTRAQLLSAEELISGDRYVFIRDTYLQRRDYLIKDGKIEDDFGGGFNDDQTFEF